MPVQYDLSQLIENESFGHLKKTVIYDALAHTLACSPATVRRYLKEPATAPAEVFIKICKIFNIEQTDVLPEVKHFKTDLVSVVNQYIISKNYDPTDNSPVRS